MAEDYGDLTAFAQVLKFEHEDEDAAHERARMEADENRERRKDFILFVFSLVIVAASALCCVLALLYSQANSAWAAPLLTLIVGGLLGYQTGKSQGTKGVP
jgi:fatty acid desaturase